MSRDAYYWAARRAIRDETPRTKPTGYRHWSGRTAIRYNDGPWEPLGWAPRPRTPWQRFCYNLAHGVIMRYPLPSVIAYALRNRDPLAVEWEDCVTYHELREQAGQ